MRLIHTADWHLGRLFHGVRLVADQAHVLEQFVQLVAEVRPDAVLIAGDIYDRAVPPDDAVDLLNDVLERIVRGLGVPVVMVAGNHDSPRRLGFAARLLGPQGLHIAGPLQSDVVKLDVRDEHGPVRVVAIPYAEPVTARATLGDESIHDHEAALRAFVGRARADVPPGTRQVLVTHAFVAGSLTSESERPLSVGGAGTVAADVLNGFDYVALGHLHRPQSVHDERLRYAGSLLKYSFQEHDQSKSVALVELGAHPGERPHVELVTLSARHDVRVVEGTLSEVMAAADGDSRRDDYICARLLDKGSLLNAMGRLQEVYPNALSIEFPKLMPDPSQSPAIVDPGALSEVEHFAAFFEYVAGEPLSAAERAAFLAVADELARGEGET